MPCQLAAARQLRLARGETRQPKKTTFLSEPLKNSSGDGWDTFSELLIHGEKIKIWNLDEDGFNDFSCMHKDFEKGVPAVPKSSSIRADQVRGSIRGQGSILLLSRGQ